MYPITDEAKELFNKHYNQTLSIEVYGSDSTFELTEKDIVQGTFELSRYCMSGEKIEIGTAIASEITFKINNTSGAYDDVVFEGAELYVKVGIKKWDAMRWENAQMYYLPLGYFTVDSSPTELSVITIQALDRMMQFDKQYDSTHTFPATLKDVIEDACLNCNVPLETDLTTLTNYDYVVLLNPNDTDVTYRRVIQWAAEITGTCAYIDWNGKLRFEWYAETGEKVTKSDRYTSQLNKNSITITGVQITDDENVKYISGTTDYAFAISDNGLIQNLYQTVSDNLNAKLNGFTYTPFNATIKPSPYYYPLDRITFADKNGTDHTTIITHTSFKLNANTAISGHGETAEQNGWAAANPLTKRQVAIIKSIQENANAALNNRIQSVLEFNDLICHSMGTYSTQVTLDDGSIKYYMHDQPRLEDSKNIFTLTADGYAWTNSGWNGGEPVWEYGFGADGNAIFKAISAYGISVSQPTTDHSVKITPDTIAFMYRLTEIMKLNGDHSTISKVDITGEMNIGSARIVPCTGGANIVLIE